MVISLTSWKFPDWLTQSTAARKRKLEPEDDEMEVDAPGNVVEDGVKKLKPNPPCKQCLAGIPGHRSHGQLN